MKKFLLFTALSISYLCALAQCLSLDCNNYNSQDTGQWHCSKPVSDIVQYGPTGNPNDYFLSVNNSAGHVYLYNDHDFSFNWLDAKECCLCWDFKVIIDGDNSNLVSIQPKISIFNGAYDNPNLLAEFNCNFTITENDGWVHICAPISVCIGGILPENSQGNWSISGGCTDWLSLIQNVDGIRFELNPTPDLLELGFDNICIVPCSTSESYCCPLPNQIINGNFELGNTAFTSNYSFNNAGTISSLLPKDYNVCNGQTAAAICKGWDIQDNTSCNYQNGSFLVVNGNTNQNNNINNIIWEQTNIALEVDSQYRFCAYAKDLSQCCFNKIPRIRIQSIPGGITPWININTNTADPCDWQEISRSFTATSNSVTIRILIDETAVGDGNDLAIDDISLHKLPKPNFDFTHQFNGSSCTASIYNITNADDVLIPTCEYKWAVAELSNINPLTILPGSVMFGNNQSSQVWDLTTNFPGYVYSPQKFYLVVLMIEGCECYSNAFRYHILYDSGLKNMKVIDEIRKSETDPKVSKSIEMQLEKHFSKKEIIKQKVPIIKEKPFKK